MSLRILIVDDNPTNLKLASDLLEMEGMDIFRAVDAESALEIVQESLPDLILMDIGLPRMDGLTLTKLLKGKKETKNIKVIALTAFAMKGDQEKIIAAGCDGYITKPINTRKFKEQLLEFL